MRKLLPLLTALAPLFGCRSTPLPSAPQPPAEPRGAQSSAAAPLHALSIVPIPALPGFQVCAACDAPRPTPKTLAPPRSLAIPAGMEASEAKPVTVRYATSIPFTFNSARIGEAGQAALAAFVSRLPSGARTSLVSVSGRTDNIGPPEANARIARARAQAVLAALRGPLRPQSEDIRAEPLCCYIASNATAAGRADNRRVDVVAIVAIE